MSAGPLSPYVRYLDQYMLRNFMLPFVYCCLGFIAVWLVYELGTNATEFLSAGATLPMIASFYAGQLPSVLIQLLPMALLLALLYCLGRMSQSNEILAMLSAGVSLGRILVPVFGAGLAVTAFSMYLSYAPAPQAEARRELAQAQIEAGSKIEKLTNTFGYLFPNRRDSRLWYIERMPADFTKPLENVQVLQQDPHGNIVTKYYARTATFNPAQHTWDFEGGRLVHYQPNGDVQDASYPSRQLITGWSETPWRIASQQLQPDKLSVPELHQYLDLNSDFAPAQLAPYRTYLDFRWALPWTDAVVVLFTAPLGIVYQRRSVLTGVAGSILMFLIILFSSNLFLALGRGSRIGPLPAAWTTNIVFAVVGLVLLRQRALNRDKIPWNPISLVLMLAGR